MMRVMGGSRPKPAANAVVVICARAETVTTSPTSEQTTRLVRNMMHPP